MIDDASPAPSTAGAALAQVTAALAAHEDRATVSGGWRRRSPTRSSRGRHLVVQAGTGTGKTLAYLVPAIVSGKRTDRRHRHQGAPGPARHEGPAVRRRRSSPNRASTLDWAVLKGRSNYLCLQRLREFTAPAQAQLELEPMSVMRAGRGHAARRVGGSNAHRRRSPSSTGARPTRRGARSASGATSAPAPTSCPMGRECFAELARDRAQVVGRGRRQHAPVRHRRRRPRCDHARARRGRVRRGARARGHHERHGRGRDRAGPLPQSSVPRFGASCRTRPRRIDRRPGVRRPDDAFSDYAGQRLRGALPDPIVRVPRARRGWCWCARARSLQRHRDLERRGPATHGCGRLAMLTRTSEYVDAALVGAAKARSRSCRAAPTTRGSRSLRSTSDRRCGPGVWDQRTAILTSATVPSSLVESRRAAGRGDRPGRRREPVRLRVTGVALLRDAPPTAEVAAITATRSPTNWSHLIGAAGGRTLALFTSWAALDHAVAAVRDRVDVPILTQRDLPKPALVNAFAASEPKPACSPLLACSRESTSLARPCRWS